MLVVIILGGMVLFAGIGSVFLIVEGVLMCLEGIVGYALLPHIRRSYRSFVAGMSFGVIMAGIIYICVYQL